jgi:transposase
MRQTHAAGERLFVDYAGDGVPVVIDQLTGEIRMAQIFVAVLWASSFTFAKATWTQMLPDWIDAHLAPSRRSAVFLNSSQRTMPRPPSSRPASTTLRSIAPYAEMAAHYGTAILPARPKKPHDKAKVEQAVLIVERWLVGRLRRRNYHSLVCTSSWSWLFNLTNRIVGRVAASAIPSASRSSTSSSPHAARRRRQPALAQMLEQIRAAGQAP